MTTPNSKQVNQIPAMNMPQPMKTIDAFELLGSVLRHWKLVVFLSMVGILVGVLAACYTRDSFENKTMLQLDTKSKSGKALADIGDLFDAQSPAVAEIHLIKSLSVLMPVVEKLHLNYSAEPIDILDRLMRREGRMDLDLFEPPMALMAKEHKWVAKVK